MNDRTQGIIVTIATIIVIVGLMGGLGVLVYHSTERRQNELYGAWCKQTGNPKELTRKEFITLYRRCDLVIYSNANAEEK